MLESKSEVQESLRLAGPPETGDRRGATNRLFSEVYNSGTTEKSSVTDSRTSATPLDEAAILKLSKDAKGLGQREFIPYIFYTENLLAQATQEPAESDLRAAQKSSDKFLQQNQYKEAIEPLKKEIEILLKDDPDGKSEKFVKPYARLAMCLRETSDGKGDKEADKLFNKTLEIIKNHPAVGEKAQREQEVYRALVLEGKGLNDVLLAKSSTDPKEREAYFKKVEQELTEFLKVFGADGDFKASPYRLRGLANLVQAEEFLGHKGKDHDQHMKELKEHPNYKFALSAIETGLLEERIAQAKDKSPTLKKIIEDVEKCPWGKLVKPISVPGRGFAQYDNLNSKIAVGDQIPAEKQPQSYAFAAYQASHQSLFKLYSGAEPVDAKTFKEIQMKDLVGAYKAEIAVANELLPDKPVDFVKENGDKVDLRKLNDKQLVELLESEKLSAAFLKESYERYQKNFAENQRILREGNFLKEGY
jgi:hypothetical protein